MVCRVVLVGSLLLTTVGCGAPPVKTSRVLPPPPRVAPPPAHPEGPSIVVTHEQILLDDSVVADAAAVQVRGRLARIDPLFAGVQRRREAWKYAHRGAPPAGAQWVTAQPGASVISTLSAVISAAYAGFPEVHFKTDTGWAVGRYVLPPPSEDVIHERALVRIEPDGIALDWQTDRPCDAAPPPVLIPPEELSSRLDAACADSEGRCIDDTVVAFDSALDFTDVVRVFDVIASHASPGFTFSMVPYGHEVALSDVGGRRCYTPLRRRLAGGRLEPEVIQKTIRASFQRVRTCYEKGLARDPKLAGRVAVRFVIDRDGRVATAQQSPAAADSVVPDLPDPAVADCVVDAFRAISFPKPDGGVVRVLYPIHFSPGED